MLGRPPQLICPELTQAQARRLNAIKRTHMVIAYEGATGHDFSAVIVVTNDREFIIREDGTDLDAALVASLPPRSARRRRRSLRNPADETEQESI